MTAIWKMIPGGSAEEVGKPGAWTLHATPAPIVKMVLTSDHDLGTLVRVPGRHRLNGDRG